MPQTKSIDAKASQSTHIVPVKGTINVETMDYSDDEGSGNIQSLDSLMADLGNMVKTPRQDTNIPPEVSYSFTFHFFHFHQHYYRNQIKM